MTKRTYDVQEIGDDQTPRKDASYRSCLCALLIFVAICVIILLVGLNWRKSGHAPLREKEEVEYVEKEKLMEDPALRTTTTRRWKPTTAATTKPSIIFRIASTKRPTTTGRPTVPSTKSPVIRETTTATLSSPAYLHNETTTVVTEKLSTTTKLTTAGKTSITVSPTIPSAKASPINEITTEQFHSKATTEETASSSSSPISTSGLFNGTTTVKPLPPVYLKNETSKSNRTERLSTVNPSTSLSTESPIFNATTTPKSLPPVYLINETSNLNATEKPTKQFSFPIYLSTTSKTTTEELSSFSGSTIIPLWTSNGTTTTKPLTPLYLVNETSESNMTKQSSAIKTSSALPTITNSITTSKPSAISTSAVYATESSVINGSTTPKPLPPPYVKNETLTATVESSTDTTSVLSLGITKEIEVAFSTESESVDETSTADITTDIFVQKLLSLGGSVETTSYSVSADVTTETLVLLRKIKSQFENETDTATDLMTTESSTTETNIGDAVRASSETSFISNGDDTSDPASTEDDFVADTDDVTTTIGNANADATDFQEIDDVTTRATEETETGDGTTIFSRTTTTKPLRIVSPDKSEPVCHTSGCKSAASRMLSLMNHSVDACEDFYEFSCGGMQADNADSGMAWNGLSRRLNDVNSKSPVSLKKFKRFYDTCVNYEDEFDYGGRVETIKSILKLTGDMDVDENSNNIDVTKLFTQLILYDSMPLIDVGIDVDKHTSKYILQLTSPRGSSASSEIEHWSALSEARRRCLRKERRKIYEPNLNLTEIHVSYLTCNKNYTTYLDSIERTLEALGFYTHLGSLNATRKIKEVRFTVDYNVLNLLTTGPSVEETRKAIVDREYTVKKIGELQVLYPLIQWKELFKSLTGNYLSDSVLVQVYFPTHFHNIFKELKHLSKSKLNNALLAIFANDLFQNLIVSNHKSHPEEYCAKLSSHLFHDVASGTYLKILPDSSMREGEQRVGQIFDQFVSNLTQALNSEEWLDDGSKISAAKKAQNLHPYFPKKDDECLTDEFLDAKYASVKLVNDYPSNLIVLKEVRKRSLYELVGKDFEEEFTFCHFIHSYDKRPFSFYSKELIGVPYGILEEMPKNLPDYLSTARIGIHLGREIGYHFDPVGIHYKMALSDQSQGTYNAAKDTTQNMLSFSTTRNNTFQMLTFKPNGYLSANLRIAENTALRLMTDSYSSLIGKSKLLPWISTTYSKEKLFFVAIAQEYCESISALDYMLRVFESESLPSSLRVENMMSNSEAFTKAFKCADGSTLNNNFHKIQFPYLPKFEYDDVYDGISD